MLQEITEPHAIITTTLGLHGLTLGLHGHLYPGEIYRHADRLNQATTNDDAAKMRPDDDAGEDDKKWLAHLPGVPVAPSGEPNSQPHKSVVR